MNASFSFTWLKKVKKLHSPILKNFFIYSFGSFLLRGTSIFIAPITMSILSPSDYGLLALANSFISISAIFLGLGLRQAFSLEYFHCNSAQRRQILNNLLFIYLIVATPLFCLLFINLPLLNYYIFFNKASYALLLTSLFICFIFFFVEFFYQVLQYQCKAFKRTVIQIVIATIIIGCNLFFLCILKLGVTSILLGQLIGMSLICTKGLYEYLKKDCHKQFNISQSLARTSYFLKRGLPFVLGVLLSWIVASGDRWLLAHFGTLHDVGIYSVANTFGHLFQMLVLYPMSGSYLPYMLNTFASNKDTITFYEQKNKRVMVYTMLSLFIIITLLYCASKSLFYWVLPKPYHQALNYVWFILMGQLFVMGTYFANCLIQFYKKTYFLAFSLAIPATLNIALNIILIPGYGIYGCVIATVLSYIAYFVVTFWYNVKIQKNSLKPNQLEGVFN